MLKGLLRFVASILLLVAVIAGVNDATRSMLAGHAVAPLSMQEHWARLAPRTLDTARKAVEQRAHPVLWELGIAKVLQLPAWALLGLTGLLFAYAGRRRRQINIYAN